MCWTCAVFYLGGSHQCILNPKELDPASTLVGALVARTCRSPRKRIRVRMDLALPSMACQARLSVRAGERTPVPRRTSTPWAHGKFQKARIETCARPPVRKERQSRVGVQLRRSGSILPGVAYGLLAGTVSHFGITPGRIHLPMSIRCAARGS
jgi:hypothetical protein